MPNNDLIDAESALTLADYTSPALIVPYLRGLDAPTIIQELSALLQREGRITDLLPFYQAALNREYLCSTVTEPGFALPHVLVKGIDKPSFALGRTPKPIAWVRNTLLRVRVVFLLSVPETDARPYIMLIRGVARLSEEAELLEELLKAKDSFEITNLLRQVKLPMNRASTADRIPPI
ncbi:MAG: PTS sugar transporter subunit IIA [Verrucomicrobia subdivision 3 bacterium]|nr:PTS sugar transporter subunit IIA [Limisphaerales bacterium]